jgi:hypothetical protein
MNRRFWRSCLGLCSLALLLPSQCWNQEKQARPKTEEEIYAEGSRQLFANLHCPQSVRDSVRAFAGCWKLTQVDNLPTDEHLTLGLNLAEDRAQLLLNSNDAQQFADSTSPRYCTFEGFPTVAPYPDADFSQHFTYAYVMIDLPPDRVEQFASQMDFDNEEHREVFKKTLNLFAARGGKLFRTLIVQGPDNVWWDDDGEEDFWAQPTSCAGWEKVEKQLREELSPQPPLR